VNFEKKTISNINFKFLFIFGAFYGARLVWDQFSSHKLTFGLQKNKQLKIYSRNIGDIVRSHEQYRRYREKICYMTSGHGEFIVLKKLIFFLMYKGKFNIILKFVFKIQFCKSREYKKKPSTHFK